jgi:hypothetical protein
VAFIIFVVLWYAAPRLAALGGWMQRAEAVPAMSMPGTVVTSLLAGTTFAALDRFILTVS